MTNQQTWEDRFDEEFSSFDKFAIYSKDGTRISDLRAVKGFIKQEIAKAVQEERERIKLGLSKTWSGCGCGFHGYQTLPDCEEEKHKVTECADCFLSSSPEEGENR